LLLPRFNNIFTKILNLSWINSVRSTPSGIPSPQPTEESLPLGNGRIGAMVFGGTDRELIQFNEDAIWSGIPRNEYNPDAFTMLPEVRKLIQERKFTEATELTTKMCGATASQSYEMAGDLIIEFDDSTSPEYYKRLLDIDCATITTSYKKSGICFEIVSYVSAVDQIFVYHIKADQPNAINCKMSTQTLLNHSISVDNTALTLTGRCPVRNSFGEDKIVWEENGQSGMSFVQRMVPTIAGGIISMGKDCLIIKDATELTIAVSIATDFDGWNVFPGSKQRDLQKTCQSTIKDAASKGWESVYRDHVKEHQQWYRRVNLDIGTTDADFLDTETRIKDCDNPAQTPGLVTLLFNYGRYLLIASSRPGTQAANLQGIWNNKLCPPWRCNYTININTEMNYWPAHTCNLSEMAEPLHRLIAELSEQGTTLAKELYHSRGWCAHHNTDIWRYASPANSNARWAFWPTVDAWLCRHLWEYFLFTNDKEFLKEMAWPVMKSASKFLLDFLIEDEDGFLVTSPSTSPENNFKEPVTGTDATVCQGTAMDLSMIRELFQHTRAAGKILDTDHRFAEDISSSLNRLRPHKIGAHGQLLEYQDDFEEGDIHHRHVSHLYGVYPGHEFTPEQNQNLFTAAKNSLNRRGDKSTGWAMGWRIALWARLLDGNRALNIIGDLLTLVDPSPEIKINGGGIRTPILLLHNYHSAL
jgi:alpha-L-fucosidase 2